MYESNEAKYQQKLMDIRLKLVHVIDLLGINDKQHMPKNNEEERIDKHKQDNHKLKYL